LLGLRDFVRCVRVSLQLYGRCGRRRLIYLSTVSYLPGALERGPQPADTGLNVFAVPSSVNKGDIIEIKTTPLPGGRHGTGGAVLLLTLFSVRRVRATRLQELEQQRRDAAARRPSRLSLFGLPR
jgi:hypothetical protein